MYLFIYFFFPLFFISLSISYTGLALFFFIFEYINLLINCTSIFAHTLNFSVPISFKSKLLKIRLQNTKSLFY